MARIAASTHIEAGPARVWDVLVAWEEQPAWMGVVRCAAVDPRRPSGPGVTLRRRVALGPVVVRDDVVTTQWDEHRALAWRHVGPVIGGVEAFELRATPHGTAIEWWQEVQPPLGAAGDAVFGALLAPVAARSLRRSLATLKRRCERYSVRP